MSVASDGGFSRHMSPKILVVDDHEAFRESLSALLDAAVGLDLVGAAGDTSTALSIARDRAPDLVMVDVELAGRNGLAVIRQILAEQLAPRVLAMSLHHDRWWVDEAMRAGACGLLIKDTPPIEMLEAIRRSTRDEA